MTESEFDPKWDVYAFAARLKELHDQRKNIKKETKTILGRRDSLTKKERNKIKDKTGGLCHICGGKITGDDWAGGSRFGAWLAASTEP